MSWDSYIDNLLSQTKDNNGTTHSDKACIIGIDGTSWTSATHANAMKLSETEAKAIAKCFKEKDFTPMKAGGIHAEGVKYQFLREEDNKLALGKKKECGAITLQKSKTAVVIAHTKEGCQQGNVNKGVAVIAEYLESMNY